MRDLFSPQTDQMNCPVRPLHGPGGPGRKISDKNWAGSGLIVTGPGRAGVPGPVVNVPSVEKACITQ